MFKKIALSTAALLTLASQASAAVTYDAVTGFGGTLSTMEFTSMAGIMVVAGGVIWAVRKGLKLIGV